MALNANPIILEELLKWKLSYQLKGQTNKDEILMDKYLY